jgi:Fe-S-cluster containining protein
MTQNSQLLNEVAALYDWLDGQASRHIRPDSLCSACGKCCNFKQFGHLLFVTGPELMYLSAKLGKKLKQMSDGICPYNKLGNCTVYDFRFSGCRIYNCNADKDFQSFLSESALKKLKSICERFDIPYKYTDLKTALESFTA